MNSIRRHRHGIWQRSACIGTPQSVGAGSRRIVRPWLALARGRDLDSQRHAPVGEEVRGRDRRARKRRPHQTHLGLRSPKSDVGARRADSNEGVEEAGASQRQDEPGERRDCCGGAAKLTPAYQDRCASGIAADEDLLGGRVRLGRRRPSRKKRPDRRRQSCSPEDQHKAYKRQDAQAGNQANQQSDQAHSHRLGKERM
jgi:hypothetical protein